MARESHVEGTGTPPALLRSSCTRSPGSWKSRLPTARRFSSRASSCASILHLRRFAATDRARRSCKSARKMSRSRTSTRSAPTRSSSSFPTATIPAYIRGHFSTTTELHQEQMWQRCSAKSVRLCPSTPPLPRLARTFSQANDHGGEVGQLPSPAGKRAGLGFHGFREEPVSIFAGLFGTVHGTVGVFGKRLDVGAVGRIHTDAYARADVTPAFRVRRARPRRRGSFAPPPRGRSA